MPGLRAVCPTNPQTFLEAGMSHNSAVRTSTDDCKLLFMTTPFYKFIISFTNGSRKVFISQMRLTWSENCSSQNWIFSQKLHVSWKILYCCIHSTNRVNCVLKWLQPVYVKTQGKIKWCSQKWFSIIMEKISPQLVIITMVVFLVAIRCWYENLCHSFIENQRRSSLDTTNTTHNTRE